MNDNNGGAIRQKMITNFEDAFPNYVTSWNESDTLDLERTEEDLWHFEKETERGLR